MTTFFNPARWQSRLRNYRIFRRNLGLPLLAVELSFDGRFELQNHDAEQLVRLARGDVMWQKERLLNLAWDQLPSHCTEVAWIDCDVLFTDPHWAARLSEKLQHHEVVHPFRAVHHLPPGEDGGEPPAYAGRPICTQVSRIADRGLAQAWARDDHSLEGKPIPGMAWAARRDWIERVQLPDRFIAGGGDSAWCAALENDPMRLIDRYRPNEAQQRSYLDWAGRVQRELTTPVASLEGNLLHLWHGDLGRRQSLARQLALAGSGFDPTVDLVAGPQEAWRWRDPQCAAARFVREYFPTRQEDAVQEAQ
ncbi:MAG: hypothetical protein V4669_11990 [Pseudomonadota bacterium]